MTQRKGWVRGYQQKRQRCAVEQKDPFNRLSTTRAPADDYSFNRLFDHVMVIDNLPMVFVSLTDKDRGLRFGSNNPFLVRQGEEIAVDAHLRSFTTKESIGSAHGNFRWSS